MINVNYPKKIYQSENLKNDVLNDLKKTIDKSDMILISKLGDLRTNLNEGNVNLRSVKQQIKEISQYDQTQNFDYLSNMLIPERARGSKIPSQIPIPSCSFQLHNSITLKTNNTGCLAFIMNPFFLVDKSVIGSLVDGPAGTNIYVSKFLSTAWLNNDDSLTGGAANDHWTPIDFGQVIPSVYNQYRLVSASMVIKYIGRLDTVQGLVGGAIFYDNSITFGGRLQDSGQDGEYDPDAAGDLTQLNVLSKYGNFDLAQDSFYHSENMALEGVRELYFPLDNSYEEYVPCISSSVGVGVSSIDDHFEFQGTKDSLRSGFQWFFYTTNAPANSPCFKCDIYCNFECLPNADFLNYMPVSLSPIIVTEEEKKKAIVILQNKPVMKSNENTYEQVRPPNLFNKMIRKFDNGLPGFDKLKAWGLMTAVPSLKPGLALAGSMLSAQTMEFDD